MSRVNKSQISKTPKAKTLVPLQKRVTLILERDRAKQERLESIRAKKEEDEFN